MGYWSNRAKTAAEYKVVAQESIRFQNRKKLASLAELVETFRLAGDFSPEAYISSGIAEWVSDTCGITILFRNGHELGYNLSAFAGVEPPKIDANNPIVSNLHRRFYQGNNDLDVYSKFIKENELNGSFNDSTGKLSGDLSKIPSPLYLTPMMFDKKLDMNSFELAAIILHEVGHVYYYFRTLMRGVIVNMIADAAANQMMNMESDVEKLRVVKDVERMLNTKINQPETIVSQYKKENLYIHLVTATLLDRTNLTGGEGFGNRSWERMADDYAARFGAASDLATGLYKLETSAWYIFRNSSYMNYGLYTFIETVSVIGAITASLSGPGWALLMAVSALLNLSIADPAGTIYDPPQQRFETMRRTLVAELKSVEGKNTKDANAHRDRILHGIEQIDGILKTVKDKDNIYSFIQKNILPAGRRETQAVDYQRDVEKYLNNDLTVSLHKLRASA